MSPFKSRRKRTFVNARVQGRILGHVAAYWVLYHVVLWHGLFVYRYAQVRMTVMDGATIAPFRSVYWQFCIDYAPLLICSVLIMPLFMMDFLRLTHRIVGPLVRATDSLQQLMDGRQVAHVEFRKGDLLTEFQATFNDFLAFNDQKNATVDRKTVGPAAPSRLEIMSETQAQMLASVNESRQPVTTIPVGV